MRKSKRDTEKTSQETAKKPQTKLTDLRAKKDPRGGEFVIIKSTDKGSAK